MESKMEWLRINLVGMDYENISESDFLLDISVWSINQKPVGPVGNELGRNFGKSVSKQICEFQNFIDANRP